MIMGAGEVKSQNYIGGFGRHFGAREVANLYFRFVESIKHALNNFFANAKAQAAVLAVLTVLAYVNTFQHGYALDDGLVIYENPSTTKGLAGIPRIFSEDAYMFFYERHGSTGELSGGRYRPLSFVTFAIEWQISPNNPTLGHIVNVLLYGLSVVVMLWLLRNYLLPRRPRLAFLATLLFALHPIHTEVVANIKSRDEIMSLLFLLLTLIGMLAYIRHRRHKALIGMGLAYAAALLSKEYGVTLIILAPFVAYHFGQLRGRELAKICAPIWGLAILYLMVRYQVVGAGAEEIGNIENNPFAFAVTEGEALATKLYVLLRYVVLLVWPSKLSFDYGYATFYPYNDLADPEVLISLALHGAMAWFAFKWFYKNPVLSFALLFYLGHLAMVSNLFFDLGASMGERLIYHSSFGFMIVVAWALMQVHRWLKTRLDFMPRLAIGGGFVILVCSAAVWKTVDRNQDWAGNDTLYLSALDVTPRSIKTLNAAATAYIGYYDRDSAAADAEQWLRKALQCLDRHNAIYAHSRDAWLNRATVYHRLGRYDSSHLAFMQARTIAPNHHRNAEYKASLLQPLIQAGEAARLAENFQEAARYYGYALQHDPSNAQLHEFRGGSLFMSAQGLIGEGRRQEAIQALDQAIAHVERSLQLSPNNAAAAQLLNNCRLMRSQI